MSTEPSEETNGPWADLTQELVMLTERLKASYRQVADEGGPSEEQIKEAFRTLGDAWNQVAGSVGEVIRNEEVRAHLRKAASSLGEAVSASLSGFTPSPDQPEPQPEGEEE